MLETCGRELIPTNLEDFALLLIRSPNENNNTQSKIIKHIKESN